MSARRTRPTAPAGSAERRLRRHPESGGAPAKDAPGLGAGRWQVSDIQRSRLLAGAIAAVAELGYEQTTVGRITTRARVSRRTFYELFAGREECLAAVLDDVIERIQRELRHANLEDLAWRERIRFGLATILAFLDSEPRIAHVCVVEAVRAGGIVQ